VSTAEVIAGTKRWHIEQGESLAWLLTLPSNSADAVICDPPYSSGGQYRGDRSSKTGNKYTLSGTEVVRPDFAGDNRDQRAFAHWCNLWLSEALRVAKSGAPIVQFSDWRQLPTTTDALQAGGWVWRGVVVWDKTGGSRPAMGRFTAQCEYALWGSKGAMPDRLEIGCLPGVFRQAVKQDDKYHQTGKPTNLMKFLAGICDPGGLILDPFCGSGSTGAGALLAGRRFLGCEVEPEYVALARERLAAEEAGMVLGAKAAEAGQLALPGETS